MEEEDGNIAHMGIPQRQLEECIAEDTSRWHVLTKQATTSL